MKLIRTRPCMYCPGTLVRTVCGGIVDWRHAPGERCEERRGRYDMPSGRTWCGIPRCCREAGHDGTGCEEDITMLDMDQLEAIRRSAS